MRPSRVGRDERNEDLNRKAVRRAKLYAGIGEADDAGGATDAELGVRDRDAVAKRRGSEAFTLQESRVNLRRGKDVSHRELGGKLAQDPRRIARFQPMHDTASGDDVDESHAD